MIIIRQNRRIKVPDSFLDEGYEFGSARVRRIKRLSGLSLHQFAEKYKFNYRTLASWMLRNGKAHNPNPRERVDLVFAEKRIEAMIRKRLSKPT